MERCSLRHSPFAGQRLRGCLGLQRDRSIFYPSFGVRGDAFLALTTFLVTLALVIPIKAGAQSSTPEITPTTEGSPAPEVSPTVDPCPIIETVSPTPIATETPLTEAAQTEDPDPTPTPTLVPDPTASPSIDPCPEPTPTATPVPSDTLGPRPYGLSGLKRMFGQPCNSKANDARTFVPNAWGRGKDGYLYYHWKLFGKVHTDVIEKILKAGRKNSIDYGVWGYNCRKKTGGSSWSVHSWGAAIDTNTLRNPYGATRWSGKGANGKPYGRYIPNLYLAESFYWGLNFRDPMHFQYVSGY